MDFDSYKRRVTLRGASKQETSRAQDLSKAKDERAARQAAKRQQAATLTIQRVWRGAAARCLTRKCLRSDWLARYGPAVSNAGALLPPTQLAGSALPPILLAYRLYCQYPEGPGTSPLPPGLLKDTAALRGALALLLRSLCAPRKEDTLFSLALDPERRPSLLSQLHRLAALCCSLLGAPGCEVLTQVAAARVLALIADSSKWGAVLLPGGSAAGAACIAGIAGEGSSEAGRASALSWLASNFQGWLAGSAMVVGAAQRLAKLAAQPSFPASGAGNSGGGGGGGTSQQPAGPATASAGTAQQLSTMLNSLIATQLRLWQQLQAAAVAGQVEQAAGGAGTASTAQQLGGQAQHALILLVTRVLTIPNLLSSLSQQNSSLLTHPSTFLELLNCAAAAAAGRASAPGGAAASATGAAQAGKVPSTSGAGAGAAPIAAGALGPGAALWLLANLTGLLAGKKARQQAHLGAMAQGELAAGKAVEYLPPSPLLKLDGPSGSGGSIGPAFAAAADALLGCAAAGGGARPGSEEALQALWPFAEGSFAAQLLAALPMEDFAHLFHSLLSPLDSSCGASRGGGSKGGGSGRGSGAGSTTGILGSARVLSALAFATPLLPRLWKWLGMAVGVPLEAPLQATRGWDIPTLGQGMHSVEPRAAEALGLFCRAYNHYLMVTDDYDFHEKQPLFMLGQQRAIAATLNTLLFRSHLPAQQAQQRQQQGGSGTAAGRQYNSRGPQYVMLGEYAPVLLRSMYERDARRPFCPPSLWLEPYQHAAQNTPSLATPPLPSSAAAQPQAPNPGQPAPAGPPRDPRPGGSSDSSGWSNSGGSTGGHLTFRGLIRGLAGRSRGRSSSSAAGEAVQVGERGPGLHLWGGGGSDGGGDGGGSRANEGPQTAGGFSAAAVVRALLHTSDADSPAEGAGSTAGMAGAAGAPASLSAVHHSAHRPHLQQQQQQQRAMGGGPASQPSALASILVAAPQCVPFEERVAIFRALIDMDKERGRYNLAPLDGGPRPLPITIRRTHVLEDALAQLPRSGEGVKGRLYVTFVNAQGLQEAGLDMGGLMKEFVETVAQAGFDRNRGLFSATPDGYAYPNPLAERLEGGLASLELLGLVLGKALYEGILLDMPLAPFFVSRLQGRWPLFDELSLLDPEVYHSLVQLKRYEGNAEDLALDFTVETDAFGARVCEELLPGGSSMPVTSANMLQYVYLMADWHLNKRLGVAAAAFGRGLSKVISPSWLRLFSPREVNQLLGGGEGGEIDVADMMRYTQYSGGYSENSSAVKAFWKVVEEMSQEERRSLLKFATSCSRAPLGGFKHLNPPLTIHKVDCDAATLALLGGKDVDRLPTASTCYNMLKLPNYRRGSTLRGKLLTAIQSGAGFELS